MIDLIYQEGQNEIQILSWTSSQAKFIYLDDTQTSHTSWPPPLGKWNQLPSQIQLVIKDARDVVNIVATPMGPSIPTNRQQDAI